MNELAGKITNFSYEVFGIIIPGAVITLFLGIWLASLGNIPVILVSDDFPILTITSITDLINRTFTDKGFGILVPLFLSWYMLGHITQWFSRSSSTPSEERTTSTNRIVCALKLKPIRPSENYSKELESIFLEASKRLSTTGEPLPWSQFYPVAKNFIARHSTNSLLSTYQNKYTLHRSITIISALLFWLDLAGIFLTLLLDHIGTPGLYTNLPLQLALVLFSAFLAWGFSGGFEFNWKMFGNTVVTETYSNIHFPKTGNTKQDERSSDT